MACNGMYVPVNSKEQKIGNIIYGGSCRALLLKKLRLLDSTALGLGPHDSERDDPHDEHQIRAHEPPIESLSGVHVGRRRLDRRLVRHSYRLQQYRLQ
jgi:hypothetical protein